LLTIPSMLVHGWCYFIEGLGQQGTHNESSDFLKLFLVQLAPPMYGVNADNLFNSTHETLSVITVSLETRDTFKVSVKHKNSALVGELVQQKHNATAEEIGLLIETLSGIGVNDTFEGIFNDDVPEDGFSDKAETFKNNQNTWQKMVATNAQCTMLQPMCFEPFENEAYGEEKTVVKVESDSTFLKATTSVRPSVKRKAAITNTKAGKKKGIKIEPKISTQKAFKPKRPISLAKFLDKAAKKAAAEEAGEKIEEKHIRPGCVRCSICMEIFPDRSTYLRHKASQHPPSPVSNMDPSLWENLVETVQAESESSEFPCKMCQASFVNAPELGYHVLQVHGKEIGMNNVRYHCCNKCQYGFKTNSECLEHKIIVHPGAGTRMMDNNDSHIVCRTCKKEFKNYANFRAHYHTEHINPEQLELRKEREKLTYYQCPHCPIEYRQKQSLQLHLKNYHGRVEAPPSSEPKDYLCDQCDRKFDEKRKLTSHITKQHSDNPPVRRSVSMDDSMKTCHHCGKVMASNKQLILHLSGVHLKLKQYVCNTCGKSFPNADQLCMHKKRHTGELTCPMCNKSFMKKQNFKEHLRAHQGIRPYKCTACDAGFIDNRALKKHALKVHGLVIKGGINKECDIGVVKTAARYGSLSMNVSLALESREST